MTMKSVNQPGVKHLQNSFIPYPAAVILHQIQPHGLNTAIVTASVNLEKEVYHIRPIHTHQNTTMKHPQNKSQKLLIATYKNTDTKPIPAHGTTMGKHPVDLLFWPFEAVLLPEPLWDLGRQQNWQGSEAPPTLSLAQLWLPLGITYQAAVFHWDTGFYYSRV